MTINNCRKSVSKIKEEVTKKIPEVSTYVLAYPQAQKGVGVHYSLLVCQSDKKVLINAVGAPGFPEYIGDFEAAGPIFSEMKLVSEVI